MKPGLVSLSWRAALVLVVGLACPIVSARQQDGFQERVEVNRLLIDVRVLDGDGHPIDGLQPADFEVSVGGRRTPVESVLWIDGGTPALDPFSPSGEGTPAIQGLPAPEGRLVVFLVQKSLESGRAVGLLQLLIKMRELLETFGFTADDRIAVLSFDTRLTVWTDFTGDLDRVRRVFEREILFRDRASPEPANGPSLLAGLTPERAARTWTIEDAFRQVGDALLPLPGAKSVVFIGHGFGELTSAGVLLSSRYAEARAALHAARATVFSLDVTHADAHSLEVGMQSVAHDTGGFFARTHLFPDFAVARLAGALAGYYVLFAEMPVLGGGAHDIHVRLKRQGTILAGRRQIVNR
jgi:VWFA-related protein